MADFLIWVAAIAFAISIVVFVIRERERGSSGRGQADGLLRAGLQETQNLLEPERKIEVVREVERGEQNAAAEHDQGDDVDRGSRRR